MELGFVGLGKMGANMVRRLLKGGHTVHVFDRSAETVQALSAEGEVRIAHQQHLQPGFRRVHANYHVPISNTAAAMMVLERV